MAITLAHGLSEEEVALIKGEVLPKNITPAELALFVQQCNRTGLDPFSRQIYLVKRGDKASIQISIDGARLIAQRTGEGDGQDGPYWCGEDGEWKDVWLSDTHPSAAKVIVYRRDHAHGYTGVAKWSNYAQPNQMWGRMGPTMIAKCAESLGLRKGFPQELSGLYTSEEMEQAEPQVAQEAEKAMIAKATKEAQEPTDALAEPSEPRPRRPPKKKEVPGDAQDSAVTDFSKAQQQTIAAEFGPDKPIEAFWSLEMLQYVNLDTGELLGAKREDSWIIETPEPNVPITIPESEISFAPDDGEPEYIIKLREKLKLVVGFPEWNEDNLLKNARKAFGEHIQQVSDLTPDEAGRISSVIEMKTRKTG